MEKPGIISTTAKNRLIALTYSYGIANTNSVPIINNYNMTEKIVAAKAITKKEMKNIENPEIEKSRAHIIVEIIEYVPNAVVIKTIIKKSTGNISVMSFDTGEGLTEKASPFDTFAQIIEGKAEIVIDNVSTILKTGECIIIPAHSPNFIKPNGRFKMILTIIKSDND
jgi:quercetin dioxygenase-like cupin family protein